MSTAHNAQHTTHSPKLTPFKVNKFKWADILKRTKNNRENSYFIFCCHHNNTLIWGQVFIIVFIQTNNSVFIDIQFDY
jgi:hypothetical protein